MQVKLLVFSLVLLYVSVYYCSSAVFRPCREGLKVDNLKEKVKITNCTRAPCRLRKKSFVGVGFKFTPPTDVANVTNSVSAEIVGIPFPFIGTDGTGACDQIYDGSNDKVKAPCPLKGGQDYVYKNSFEVLDLYPNVKVLVRWALTSPNGELFCMEVPARITN